MQQPLIAVIESFMAQAGLSPHRTGILLARNGKLVERLKGGGRIWPETEQAIRAALARESAARGLPFEIAADPPKPTEDAA